MLGGRRLAGAGQLLLALIGFGLFMWWGGWTMVDYYGLIMIGGDQREPVSHAVWGWWGTGLMVVAWGWSWVTSLSLLREARENEAGRGDGRIPT